MAICFITGIKHSGKSLLGSLAVTYLSTKQQIKFIDSDNLLLPYSQSSDTSVRDLFSNIGKERFMQVEYRAIREALEAHDTTSGHLVMATGGGACDNARLVDLMKQSGSVIYLYRKEQWLFDKIAASGIPPFLDQDNPRRSFHLLYLERDAIYRSIADYMLQLIDSDSVEHNVQILVQLLSSIL
ncbi:MAG: shikimate kinase [Sphaerochaetaceae bacterium]|jgi:shikimate kinase|nr:hypothetical protein [Sphaerochaetaceae bacterium]MDD4259408.1 shikimate kinase [Sphaerochaetaceae bacterium]MDD4762849.1 shikimate kinase [Sphaerochaetaceae bacterium]MDD4842444.1 shikimate kinase [Sphaerochaetaceae bacterium]MDX9933473.1 shikimate kinase [Sphaerochaetaceae bacterium]